MPDDRPVSPEEHDERESAYANGYEHGRRDEREAAIEAGVFRFGAYVTPAALSTPAGPSPEPMEETWRCPNCSTEYTCAGECGQNVPFVCREQRVLVKKVPAPSPREEAVEAGRVYWIIACAECGEQFQPIHARNGVDPCGCFGAHPPTIIRVPALSAARPSSPTPEETP